jgi:low affinity Fe/Cu permease
LTQWTGSPYAGVVVGTAIALWLLVGFGVDFSRPWELCVTAGLPIVNLGALIVIQHTQTHDDRAMQLKLDELIRALDGASSRMMRAEEEDWEDLDDLQQRYRDESLRMEKTEHEHERTPSGDRSSSI